MNHLVEEGRRVVPGERRLPGRRVGQHRAEREHVGGAGDPLAEDLLGGHVAGRADGDAGGGEGGGPVGGPRDAEVDQPGAVEAQHHVRRLHVPVDEAQPVDGHQGAGQAFSDGPYGGFGKGPVRGHRAAQGGPRHVPGGHPRHRRLRVGVQDGRGPLAADAPRGLDLAAEPGAELLVGGEVRVHDLDGHRPAARAAAQVDPSHAAGAEPAEQPVRADGPRFACVERLHRVPLPVRSLIAKSTLEPSPARRGGSGRLEPGGHLLKGLRVGAEDVAVGRPSRVSTTGLAGATCALRRMGYSAFPSDGRKSEKRGNSRETAYPPRPEPWLPPVNRSGDAIRRARRHRSAAPRRHPRDSPWSLPYVARIPLHRPTVRARSGSRAS